MPNNGSRWPTCSMRQKTRIEQIIRAQDHALAGRATVSPTRLLQPQHRTRQHVVLMAAHLLLDQALFDEQHRTYKTLKKPIPTTRSQASPVHLLSRAARASGFALVPRTRWISRCHRQCRIKTGPHRPPCHWNQHPGCLHKPTWTTSSHSSGSQLAKNLPAC